MIIALMILDVFLDEFLVFSDFIPISNEAIR